MYLREIADGMWKRAKQGPASQWIKIEGHRMKVTCIRQVCDCGCHVRFIFWINGNPAPWSLIRRVRQVFIPNGVMYPGDNGEMIQYVQEVCVDRSRSAANAEREVDAIAGALRARLSSIRGRLVPRVQLSDTAAPDGH